MNTNELIMTRKSVRTFDKREVSSEDKAKILEYMENIENPYGITVDFVWLDADANGLSSPVIKGEKAYIAGKVKKCEHCEEAYGYSFEKLVLFLWSMGIGTTWIGGTMKREVFEKAANVKDDELMMCVTPVGYPAKKKSIIDKSLRASVHGDARLEASKLFFENNIDTPIKEADDALEAVRWAPTAANMQPCRIVKAGNVYHFYKKPNPRYKGNSGWDVQKVDMGIALCHFMTVAGGTCEISKPDIKVEDEMEYIVSVTV